MALSGDLGSSKTESTTSRYEYFTVLKFCDHLFHMYHAWREIKSSLILLLCLHFLLAAYNSIKTIDLTTKSS